MYLHYKCSRLDIKSKWYLGHYETYYASCLGIRHNILGCRKNVTSVILDDIVLQELIRRGCRLSTGKVEPLEVDFVAEKDSEHLCIQVCLLRTSLGAEDLELVVSEESMIIGLWCETPIGLEHLCKRHVSHWSNQWTP